MLLLLCIMLDSDPDRRRRGRTSVCRRITHFLDQRINAKFAKSMSASATACLLPTGRKRRHWRQSLSPRMRRSPYSGLTLR